MSQSLIVVEFNQLPFIDDTQKGVEIALVRALNYSATKSRTTAAREARKQVNFPASYLSPSSKRLWVKTKAKRGVYHTVIEGRGDPTSLARFSKQTVLTGGKRHKGGKVNVSVKPGSRKSISRAFIIRLRGRNGMGENLGLAVRTSGTTPRNAWHPKNIGKNLWLLYGPSVDQALSSIRDSKGVFEDITPEALDLLEQEFTRQLELLNGR